MVLSSRIGHGIRLFFVLKNFHRKVRAMPIMHYKATVGQFESISSNAWPTQAFKADPVQSWAHWAPAPAFLRKCEAAVLQKDTHTFTSGTIAWCRKMHAQEDMLKHSEGACITFFGPMPCHW